MIYITGDTHGRFERIEDFCRDNNTTSDDIIIILGDLSMNYYLDARDEYLKREVAKLAITIFAIHGNHEERPYNVCGYRLKEWHGGMVYVDSEYPNQIFAKDGEIYSLDDKKVVVIGGAYSVGKPIRLKKKLPWFESEQPDSKIKADVEKSLCNLNWKVDIVLSHTCPSKYIPEQLYLSYVDQTTVDRSTEEWLQKIEDSLKYKKWYFGHFHGKYKKDKLQCLYKSIIPLGEKT